MTLLVYTLPPVVIEIEEEVVEVPSVKRRTPHTLQIHDWIMDFVEAVGMSFDPPPLGEALITVVKEATKILLNTTRVAGAQTLAEKLTETLTKVLALLQKREN